MGALPSDACGRNWCQKAMSRAEAAPMCPCDSGSRWPRWQAPSCSSVAWQRRPSFLFMSGPLCLPCFPQCSPLSRTTIRPHNAFIEIDVAFTAQVALPLMCVLAAHRAPRMVICGHKHRMMLTTHDLCLHIHSATANPVPLAPRTSCPLLPSPLN